MTTLHNMDDDDGEEEVVERGTWSNKLEFILSCVGLSVGMGNVWRFPYVAYEHGGGTFQLPYIILLVTVGIPLYLMEIIRGQYSQLGPVAAWKACPAGVGIGWAMIVICFVGTVYYNVILAYALVYMLSSFTELLPWEQCLTKWGADKHCYVRSSKAVFNYTTVSNSSAQTYHNASYYETASQQYWERFVLNIGNTTGIDNLGKMQWRIVTALAFTWFCIFLCVFQGIKTIGKVVYFTATFPYIILLAFLVQGAMLDGADYGLKFFFMPTWDKLLEADTWMSAARQMVYSLGLANGALITLASYNTFHNTCHRDAIHVATLDFLTSFMASIIVFSVLGALAKDLQIPVTSVFKGGQGLAFIIFPEVVTRFPIPQLWCFSFFFMLFILGIDSSFTTFESFWSTIMDVYPFLRKYQTRLYFASILGYILLGLPFTTQGGQYLLIIVDNYNTMGRALLATLEVIVIMWVYGYDRFAKDMQCMVGFRPNLYFQICWRFISPIILVILTIATWVNFSPPIYGSYHYPFWAHIFGWMIFSLSIGQIFLGAAYAFYTHWKRGDIWSALKPTPEWRLSDDQSNDIDLRDLENHDS